MGMRNSQNIPLLRALASEVKARRGELKINQEELAHRAGVHRSFIARLEFSQTQPSLGVLFQIAEALETTPSEFVACIDRRFRVETD